MGDRRWVVRTWILVALFGAVAITRSVQLGIPFRDPHGTFLAWRVGTSLALLAVLAVADAAFRSGRHGRTPRRVIAVLRERWSRRRIVLTLGALLAYHLVYFSYRNLKSWDVFNSPHDAMLLRWDRWLFLGHSPAVLLHDLLGDHVAAYVLMVFYESFSKLITFAVVAAVVFVDRIRDGYVFIASALWVWIIGLGSYYLIPTLGPFWSAPGEFAGLPHTRIQDTQAKYLGQRDYLLAHPHASDAFAQISAFASLHVAVTTLVVLMARYYGLRRTARVLTAYLVVIILATVYLGWHFAVDDLAGLAIAFLATFLGRRMIYPRGRPPESGSRAATPVPARTSA